MIGRIVVVRVSLSERICSTVDLFLQYPELEHGTFSAATCSYSRLSMRMIIFWACGVMCMSLRLVMSRWSSDGPLELRIVTQSLNPVGNVRVFIMLHSAFQYMSLVSLDAMRSR